MVKKTPNITTLANGLRIATDEMKDVETVSIAVFVNTGSLNETEATNGISHFLEHMAFKGTKTRTARQIAEEFEGIGGKINAYTSKERTVYYVKVLKKYSEFAVEFLADILQESTFQQVEVDKERGVILQEIAMTNDTPDDIIFDYFSKVCYGSHPLGKSILGPAKNIKKFQRQDFITYIQNQYNYSNIAVVASGNIKEEDLVKYTKKHFTSLKKGKISKPAAAPYLGGDLRKQKDLEQINLLLGFEGFSATDKNYYCANALAMILGGGMSSRLFQGVRENLGLAYTIYAFNQSYKDSGVFGIYAGTTKDKVNKLIEATCEELKKVVTKISKAELGRVVTQYEASLLMLKESTNSRAQRLGSDILTYGRIISDEEVMEKISSITLANLRDISGKIFSSSKPSFAAIGKTSSIQDYSQIVKKVRA